jgi:hypothetical protein
MNGWLRIPGRRKGFLLAVAFTALAASNARALTAADSGWAPLFNGKGFPADSFYVYQSGYVDIAKQTKFTVDSGLIRGGGSYALLVTKKEYSYYRVRVDYRFGSKVGGNGNAGLMILIDNTAAKTVKGVNRPRSIEINCRRDNNYPWSLWGGKDFGPYITSTRKKGSFDLYEEGGELFTDDITADNNRVWRSSYPMKENPPGEWNHGEAWVYGDSGVFILNGALREKAWGWVTKKGDPSTKTASGGIGVQTEGYDIAYKNWEVMEMNPNGTPVNIPREKFTIRQLQPSMPVLMLDHGNLDAVLRETPTGREFKWLNVYTPQGRRVTSFRRSDANPLRFDPAPGAAAFGAGPFLLRWSPN